MRRRRKPESLSTAPRPYDLARIPRAVLAKTPAVDQAQRDANPRGATEDRSAAFRVDAGKNDASPRARAVGERLTPYSLIASRAAEAIAGEVAIIVAIIVLFMARRASVPA